jgi:4-amino-4-deoxy-L-arabinose transferase-like glycosyltransferase
MVRLDTSKAIRTIYLLIVIGFIFSLVVRIFLTTTRRFDADEFEHLHASWMVHEGYLPYRDFWQNHTPLLYYAVAPLFSIFEEGSSLVLLIRFLFSAFAFVILWQTYLLARLDHDRMTGILSVLVLSCSYLFLHKTIEIRPDHFLVAFWLASLLLLIRHLSKDHNAFPILMSGFLLGIGMLFTPKALLCLAAAFLIVLSKRLAVHGSISFLQIFKLCCFYLIGFLIPFGAAAAFFYANGILHLFFDSNVTTNLNFPFARKLAYLLSLRYSILFFLCAAGVAVCVHERAWWKGYGSRVLIATSMIFLVIIFFFFLPASSPQSALIFVPLMSIFCGIGFKKTVDWYSSDSKQASNRRLSLILFFLGAVLLPCAAALYEKPSTSNNAQQLEMIDAIVTRTSRQDVFFDGNIAYVFQPQAYYYGSLIEEIVAKIDQGEIKESIPASLKEKRCKFVIYDDRIARLPENILSFIGNNYIPSDIPGVHIAGKQLGPENFAGKRAKFWIQIPMNYEISVNNSRNFSVDKKPYKGPIFLAEGVHNLTSSQPLISVRIRAASQK